MFPLKLAPLEINPMKSDPIKIEWLSMVLIIFLLLTPPADCLSSGSILDLIEKCSPVILDGVQIDGDLVFDNLNPCEECCNGTKQGKVLVKSNITVRNCTFLGKVSLQEAEFQKMVEMKDNIFLGDVSFKGAHFLQKCSFDRSSFSGGADLSDCQFFQDASFDRCSFDARSIFSRCHFWKLASFESARLGETTFKEANFSIDADFGRSIFAGCASFENAAFHRTANFYDTQFMDEAYLRGAGFHGNKSRFARAVFNKAAIFSEAIFKEATFAEARFAGEARFMNASFLGKTSFVGTDFKGEALFYKANFSSQIYLTECSFQQLYLHWNAIREKLKIDANGEIFNKMIENYKRLGWLADNKECYLDQRHWLMEKKPWTDPSKAADIFLESYCGYGSRPERALFWIIPIVIFFGLIYWWNGGVVRINKPDLESGKARIMARRERDDIYLIEFIVPPPARDASQAKSFLRSVWFSFLIFSSRDRQNMQAEGEMERCMAWEQRLGLVLFTIFTYYVGNLIISYFTPSP